MKKLYYTDPLAAAYMAREYAVKFQVLAPKGDGFGWYDFAPDWKPFAMQDSKFYVHPDSLSVFEPQVGDLITDYERVSITDKADKEFPNKFCITKTDELFDLTCLYQFILTEENYDNAWSCNHWGGQKIIQRDGKPFFWPESE